MGEIFKCVFGFMTKSACAAAAVWIVSGTLTFLPPAYWPRGVGSMSEGIAGWAFMVFVLASTVILFDLFRWGSEAAAVVRKRTRAVRLFNRLPPAARSLVLENYETNRIAFFGDIHRPDISALVQHGFVSYVGTAYAAGEGVTDRLELSPMMRDLLEHRREELVG